ncbi:ecto-ADP-ribosyltransferase 5-like [Gracilinanus agilis]|uniref:ecto-ADP-ribosyltransferase 5-like n=1 Tax=Gracilinanus agilis TaxID=191870 RepID=UPI001CFD1E03|nr:ecto-ADP-ribosyltransferase 5-like [Gracilinanus agilis]
MHYVRLKLVILSLQPPEMLEKCFLTIVLVPCVILIWLQIPQDQEGTSKQVSDLPAYHSGREARAGVGAGATRAEGTQREAATWLFFLVVGSSSSSSSASIEGWELEWQRGQQSIGEHRVHRAAAGGDASPHSHGGQVPSTRKPPIFTERLSSVRGKTLPLDMAPNTFDDAYTGCVEEMEQIAPRLFQEEMAQNQILRESWETATAFLKNHQNLSLPPGFTTQHAMAVIVYTNSSNILHRELNSAVRTLGSSIDAYMEHFPFKALHFYLMRALQLLRVPESCKDDSGQEVFRGVGSIHFEPRKLGESIRFGQFTSTSEEWKVAQMYGNATLFTLSTCFGASIKKLSIFPNEQEVLIPPNEVFQVSNFSQEGAQNLVTLRSLKRTCSNFNCAYLKSEY